jgi:hypothetical protein
MKRFWLAFVCAWVGHIPASVPFLGVRCRRCLSPATAWRLS